jgi:predicted site-specific integrase-resolvase
MVRNPPGAENVDAIHDDLMTARELAGHLGVRPGTILDWHRQGKIPGRRLSHKVLRFSLRDVVNALETRHATCRQGGGHVG